MKLISHVRKGAVTKALFTDDTGDLCRLDVGRDKEGQLLALLFFDNFDTRAGEKVPSRDPDGRANFKYVITIRDGVHPPDDYNDEPFPYPCMQKCISLTPTRANKFRFMDLGDVPVSEDVLQLIEEHEED